MKLHCELWRYGVKVERAFCFHYARAVEGIDEESRMVLSEVEERIVSQLLSVQLEPGNLLLVDNYHMIQGRTQTNSRFDGSDRWLQRVLLWSRRRHIVDGIS